MSYSADLSFQLITRQKGLLDADRLESALREAQRQGVLLESYLVDQGEMSAEDRARVARIRKRHAKTCQDCRRTTYLLPGQTLDEPCEHCGGSLGPYQPGHTGRHPGGARGTGRQSTGRRPRPTGRGPRPTGRRSAEAPAGADPYGGGGAREADPYGGSNAGGDPYGGSSASSDPYGGSAANNDPYGGGGASEPEERPSTARFGPRGWDAEPPPPPPTSSTPPTNDWRRPAAPPTPVGGPPGRTGPELNGWQAGAATAAARMQSGAGNTELVRKVVMLGLIVVVLAVFYYVFAAIKDTIFTDYYTWHPRLFKAEDASRRTQKLLIVMREDPRDIKSDRFKKNVLKSSEVLEFSEKFVWYKEDTNGRLEKDRSTDYGILRGAGGSPFPHIFVYTPDGRCVDGTLEAASMDETAFAAFLQEVLDTDYSEEEDEDDY